MKQIYGIDLSKEKFDVNFISEKGFIKELEVKNKYRTICKFLSSLNKDAIICIEHTGIYGELLVFLANCFNISICSIPGYEIKHSLGIQKGKSDPVDAARIREYGERFYDKLKESFYYSEQIHELRELHSLRQIIVKQRKMLKNHKTEKDKSPFCSIKAESISNDVLINFNQQISEIEKQINEIIEANEELSKNSRIIQSVKGMGKITANELIIKTNNFTKLKTARKAASFAGVCPFPNSSGKMVKKSKVSPMSDKSLKTLLYLCASSAIQHNKDMKYYYERKKAEGKPSFLALNNVANKLLRTVYALIESGQIYDPFYIRQDPRLDKKIA